MQEAIVNAQALIFTTLSSTHATCLGACDGTGAFANSNPSMVNDALA